MQLNIINGIKALYYFFTHDFNFETQQLQKLFSELDKDDRKIFNFDHATIDWTEYHTKGMRQIRKLLLKEDEDTLPLARVKVTKLFYADLAIQVLFASVLFYYMLKIVNLFMM